MVGITGGAITDIAEGGRALIDPIYFLGVKVLDALPGIIVAIILLIIGYVIASILGHVVRVVLEKLGVDRYLQKAQLTKSLGHTSVPNVLGEVTKWFVFIALFMTEAAKQLKLGVLSDLLVSFSLWLPNLIWSILILYATFALANIASIVIRRHSKLKGIEIAGKTLKVTIVIIGIVLALNQLGVETRLVEDLIKIIIAGIAVGLALALGIGLGLGLKKEGEGLVKEIKKSL